MAATTAIAPAEVVAQPEPSGARRLWLWTLAALGRSWVQVALAGLFGVLVTVLVMPPPPFADTYRVWDVARTWPQLPAGYPPSLMHHALRLGVVLPTRVAQEIFGPGLLALQVTSAAFMALFSAGTYAAARALFGRRAGVAVGVVALPVVLLNPYFTWVDLYAPRALSIATGSLDPDLPAAGLFSLGIAAVVVASRRSGRRQLWWLAAGGACLGLAYLAREFVAPMFVVVPVVFYLLRIPWRRLVVPALPALAILGVELAINAALYGDALARYHVAAAHGGERAEPVSLIYVLSGFAYYARNEALAYVFPIALVVTAAGVLLLRDRRLILLVVWFGSLWLPLTLLGGILDPYEPNLRVHLPRYWMPVQGAVVVGALATCLLLFARLRGMRLDRRPFAVGLALVLAGYLALCLVTLGRVNRDQDWRELRAFLAVHPEITMIRTDDRTHQTATFYTKDVFGEPLWRGTFDDFHTQPERLPVVRGNGVYLQTKWGSLEQPDPAKGWRVVFRSTNGVLTIWQRT
jgi:hypothetical protein